MESENCGDLDNVGRVPSTVTTLYHARNSNVFRSSESSVQVTSAQNNNSGAPTQSQNFCELDIVTRRERERKEANQPIDQQLKGLPMSINQGVFRKKIYDKQVKERQSGVLCLGNLVKDVDEDYCKPIISGSRDKRERGKSPILLSCNTDEGTKQKELVDFLKREFKDHIEEGETLEFNEVLYQSHRVQNSRNVSQRRRSPQTGFDQNPEKQIVGQAKHIMTESDISSQANAHRDFQNDFNKCRPSDNNDRVKVELGNFANSEYMEQIKEKETVEYNYDNEVIYETHCVNNSRSVSRRRKAKSPSPRPVGPKPDKQIFIDPKRNGKFGKQVEPGVSGPGSESAKKTIKFADLEEARTMYFVKLPNQNTFTPQQYKTKKKIKNKHQRDFGECSHYANAVEREDPKLGRIIINKLESDIPTFTSLETESSVPVKLKSDTSLDCIMMYDGKKTSNRQHQNSPRDENMGKFVKNKDDRKLKHKKKLRPSPRGSIQLEAPNTSHPTDNTCDTVPCKEEKKKDAEISVLYKKKYDDRPESTDPTYDKHRHRSPKPRQKSSGKEKSSKGKSSKKDKSSVREKSPIKENQKKNKAERNLDGKKKRPASASVRKMNERDDISKNLKVKEAMEPQAHTDSRKLDTFNDFQKLKNSGNLENMESSKHFHNTTSKYETLPDAVKQSVLKSVNIQRCISPTRHSKHGNLETGEGIELKYQQAITLETTEIQELQADDAVVSIYITDSVLKSGSYSIAHESKNRSLNKTPPMLTLQKNKNAPITKPTRISLKTSASNDFNSSFRRKKLKKKQHPSRQHVHKANIESNSEMKKSVTIKMDTESILASVESIEKDIDNLPEEKSIMTGNMPSGMNCQEVAVCTPALKYLGYFVPPQVAERFSRKYSSPHSMQSTEISTRSSAVPCGVNDSLLLPHIRNNRSRSCVIKKGDASGFDETDLTSRPSKLQLNSRMSSDTQIVTPLSRKKRSKSVVTKVECTDFDRNTLNTIESQEHLCEELKKLIVLQQSDSKKKRWKVVPRTIEGRRMNHDFLRMNSLAEYDRKPTPRLKPKIPSRSEQEAILNLPICQHDGTTTSNLPSTSDMSSKFKSNSVISRNTVSRYSLSTEDELCRQDVKKKRKKIRKTVDRCNVSAASLSVKPISELQCSSVIQSPNAEERPNLITEKPELTSESTSRSYVKLKEEKRLVNAHMILGEKILEICNKTASKDGKVMEGYTVSGMEPPKRLTYSHVNASPIVLENCEKLHIMFFPPTQIYNSEISPKEAYTFGKFMQQQAVKETVCEKPIENKSLDSPENDKPKETIRSPIQVKTKRKLIPFETKKKSKCATLRKHLGDMKIFKKSEKLESKSPLKSKAGSSVSLDVSTTDADKPKELKTSKIQVENNQWKPKKALSPPREIRSLSRINSAVKVMESSLQIIKEESQSTDSSSKNSKGKGSKKSKIDIKQSSTQTELVTSDIEKLKDVINYLYFAMDKRISADTISTDTGRTDEVVSNLHNKTDRIDFSSTDTSSCCEQFKNMVKNVKPKFGTLRRLSKTELSHRSPVISRTSSADGGFSSIPTRPYRRPYSHRTDYGFVLNEARSEAPIIYSSSGSAFQCIPNENTKKRSQSLGIISPSRYPASNTYGFVQERVVEKVDKAICTDPKPEIKSSTSISDFSSIVITLDENPDMSSAEVQKDFEESYKQNEEKSIQCVITESTTRKACSSKSERARSESTTTQCTMERSNHSRPHHPSCISEQISVSSEKDSHSNKKTFEHKCLQTSVDNLISQHKSEPKKKAPHPTTNIYDMEMPKRSSHSFIGQRRRHIACPSLCTHSNSGDRAAASKYYKLTSSNDEQSPAPSKKASSGSDAKKPSGKNVGQMDYVNLLKLERHLEQVLGLYPTVCKAIRAQMATNMTNKKQYKRMKQDRRMFTSQETLATTVDTITEYNMIETDDSRRTRSKERLNRNMSMKLPLNRYLFDSSVKFQRSMPRSREHGDRYSLFPSSDERFGGRGPRRNLDFVESPIPFTDTSSTSGEDYLLRYGNGRKASKTKWDLKKKKKNGDYDSSNMFSDDLKDNWSVGSPLYSVSTPSLTFSKTDYGIPKSKSLTHSATNPMHTSQLSTSKSLVEISSSKSLNRKVLMQRLKEDILNDGRSRTFRLGTQQVFVLSVDSSKPLPASPSKLLATVEHQLKNKDSVDKSKATVECKRRSGERNSYGMLFSDHNRIKKGDPTFNHRPFFIHNTTRGSSSDVLLDSLNHKTSRTKSDEEDLGNFSADSLDSSDSRCDFNYSMDFMCSNIFPPKQNYFVYTSTVNYGSNGLNHEKEQENDRSRPVGRQTASKRSCSSKQSSSKSKPTQTSEALVGTTASLSAVQTSSTNKSSEDSSNTLLSESGYETSNKTKPTASIKNFFKKGGSLLDIFRHTSKTKAVEKVEDTTSGTNLTNFSNLWSKTRELHSEPSTRNIGVSANAYNELSLSAPTKVYWASLVTKDKLKQPNITFTSAKSRADKPERKDKGTSTCANKRCSVSCTRNYEKQKHECHEYAEKVLLESQLRKEGSTQYKDFKEIPLELLIGRPVPSNKYTKQKSMEKPSTSFAPPPEKKYPYCERECCLTESVPYVTVADDKIIFTSTTQEKPEVSTNTPRIIFASVSSNENNKLEEENNTSPKNHLWACGSLNNMIYKPKCFSKGVQKDGEKQPKHYGHFKRTLDKSIGIPRNDPLKRSSQADMGCACDFDDGIIEALEKVPVGTMTFGDIPANLLRDRAPKRPSIEKEPFVKVVAEKEPLRSVLKKLSDSLLKETAERILEEAEPLPIPPLPMDSVESIELPSLETQVPARSKSVLHVPSMVKELQTEKKSGESIEPTVAENLHESSAEKTIQSPEKSFNALYYDDTNATELQTDEAQLLQTDESVETPIKSALKLKVTISQNVDDKSVDTGDGKSLDHEDIKPEISFSDKPLDSEVAKADTTSTATINLSQTDVVITSHSCESFVEKIMDEILTSAVDESYLRNVLAEDQNENAVSLDDESIVDIASRDVDLTQDEARIQATEDYRNGLTDKQVFDKLLTSFEKEDEIAVRLSKDDTFFNEQIQTLKRESEDSLENEQGSLGRPEGNLFSEDTEDRHRSTHFWEEKMKALRAKEENPVKTDDIGTCFSRGFRPDNIALSGDACFNLNKQDKIKFTRGMLTNEESIIDFSERETPLDYLLALGFMVDEASNALKDDDIRSRLLAAITEARVWINKITTTQGTLLYLVAYKSRPKTMRYFLQLVEAIINKRINNAIKLDGFLRILEKVEEGEIQMINILGADKFEDEENEEKIVKKQLRQLFITVYKIAERESLQRGKELSPQAIVLLRILAAKYRAGLHPHLELIARYIGQDLLVTETQLEAAMIFLSRLDTAEVKLKEFEAYCDIKCEKKKQKRAGAQEEAKSESDPKKSKDTSSNDMSALK